MNRQKVYIVYHVDGDSWTARPDLPIAVFIDPDEAMKFASKQPGYGYNRDWFVKPVDFYFRKGDSDAG